MHKHIIIILLVVLFSVGFWHNGEMALAAQQYQGVCSQVKMQILQEVTLERTGFLATLEITNNEGDASITDFSAVLTFEKEPSTPDETPVDAADLFFVQPPDITGIDNIDGTGIIHPGGTAVIRWFIIPRISAGGTEPDGIQYSVGADLGGSIYNQQIAPELLMVIPDTITVRPEPQLEITYFQPRDVDGDDPFTLDVVEAPVPFTLGVLVKNAGYGTASSIKIESEQPQIVENEFGLTLIPSLIGARVNDVPVDNASLALDIGDIEPGQCRKGAWDMITSLSGEFTAFNASYTHSSELGGRDTSIINAVDAYFMAHEVLNDQPGRDDLTDFLAVTTDDTQLIPDTLFESDCVVSPVNHLANVQAAALQSMETIVTVTADKENWCYMRVQDPAQAKYNIASVIRSDGKRLNPNNYWTHTRYRESDNEKLTWLNIFDFVTLGEYNYTVTYQTPSEDTAAPVTTLRFTGEVEEKEGIFYILPQTQLFFTSEDQSPISIYRKNLSDDQFIPAVPFTISDAGEYTIEYYAQDASGNIEDPKSAVVVVSAADPGFDTIFSDTEEFFLSGDALSIRSSAVQVAFAGTSISGSLTAGAAVYQGVWGFPTVSGVPSSPTPDQNASIFVGGENVDFYRYRVGTSDWSAEFPVYQPISLDGLNGEVTLHVSGRNQHGEYHPDDQAVAVSWTVDPSLPADHVSITGTPETPSRDTWAGLTIADSLYYCYRKNHGFYQPDPGTGEALEFSHLEDGLHTLDVVSRTDAGAVCPAEGSDAMVRWTVDRLYGLRFPMENMVRTEDLGQIDDSAAQFIWDGRDDSGVIVAPGWYTIKITLSDGLGRSNSAVKIVRVGELLTDDALVPDSGPTVQKEPHVYGKWVVWQDQRHSNWDIFALETTGSKEAVQITANLHNQERPRTDGRFVVWEDRQPDGTWDIWAKELGTADPSFAVTHTPGRDEKKPMVYWPWIVFQSKSASDPNAIWQVNAYNLLESRLVNIAPGSGHQIDPWIHRHHVVWQDSRHTFPEVYYYNLKTQTLVRITDSSGTPYQPVVHNHWIAWSDNRNGQLDIYGYNLRKNKESQLTDTIWNERSPRITGDWIVYTDDAVGQSKTHLNLLSVLNQATLRVTNKATPKETPGIGEGKIVWTDQGNGFNQIMMGTLPDLMPVYNNQNLVAITQGMVNHMADAFTLLSLWHKQAGVTSITRFTSLSPSVVSETVQWENGSPAGNNFILEAGGFLWVKFGQTHILDFGSGICSKIDLHAGINVFNYPCFPDNYSAFKLILDIGIDRIKSLRFLDAGTGRWETASVINNKMVGSDFSIPRIAVVMLDMKVSHNNWKPGEQNE